MKNKMSPSYFGVFTVFTVKGSIVWCFRQIGKRGNLPATKAIVDESPLCDQQVSSFNHLIGSQGKNTTGD